MFDLSYYGNCITNYLLELQARVVTQVNGAKVGIIYDHSKKKNTTKWWKCMREQTEAKAAGRLTSHAYCKDLGHKND